MIQVNILAIIIAAVVSMVLGFIWYSPMVLGKPWMKQKGLTKETLKKSQKEMGKWYIVSFVVALITAFVLSHVMTLSMAFFNYPLLQTGLTTAFWMWIGFIMPVQLTAAIFGDKKFTLFAIDTGYQLVSVIGMATVLALLY